MSAKSVHLHALGVFDFWSMFDQQYRGQLFQLVVSPYDVIELG